MPEAARTKCRPILLRCDDNEVDPNGSARRKLEIGDAVDRTKSRFPNDEHIEITCRTHRSGSIGTENVRFENLRFGTADSNDALERCCQQRSSLSTSVGVAL